VEVHPIPRNIPLSQLTKEINLQPVENGVLNLNISNMAQKELLNMYVPPSAIITDFGEILYIHGRLGNYLEPAPGKAKLNITDMAREGLKFELNSAIQNVINKKNEVIVEGLRVKTNGGHVLVNINIKPLEFETTKGLLIVSFEEIPMDKKSKGDKIKLDMVTRGDERIRELENDLKQTKEQLNVTIEEMKSSNEELRSANEELQSMNEEAQSTNEELETSKEELQSINEEIVTVNNELQMKIEELSQAKDDMNNLFNSTEIAIIFLDKDLKIRRFTKEATNLINMIESDIGRPITDISSKLKYDNIMQDAEEVLERVTYKEIEIETKDEEWYYAKIMPYKTSKNVIDGVVITFTDISQKKKQLLDAENLVENIFKTIRIPLMMLDSNMMVLKTNQQFYQFFKVKSQETIGKSLYTLGNGQWNLPSLKKLLEDILPKNIEITNYEMEVNFPKIGARKILLNAIKLQQEGTERIIVSMEDISDD
jgi:two-component system CheB/CheR fusion protein